MGKTKKRVKADAAKYPVPQNEEEAREQINRIGIAQRELRKLDADLSNEVAAAKLRCAEKATPLQHEIKGLAAAVQIWCEANRARLTKSGERKFFDFSTGRVQWRMTPPKVSLRKIEDVLKSIRKLGLGRRFIRMKPQINKEAMLRTPEIAKTIEGVSISQREEFVITPTSSELEEVLS